MRAARQCHAATLAAVTSVAFVLCIGASPAHAVRVPGMRRDVPPLVHVEPKRQRPLEIPERAATPVSGNPARCQALFEQVRAVRPLPPKVDVIRELGSGYQGDVFLVQNESTGHIYAEKVFRSDSYLAPPGVSSMNSYALHQFFSLNYTGKFLADLGIKLKVVRAHSVSYSNRFGIETDAVFTVGGKPKKEVRIAPTISMDYIEGQTMSDAIHDRRIPLDKRLEMVERLNEISLAIQNAIRRMPQSMVLENHITRDGDWISLGPTQPDQFKSVDILILDVDLTNIPMGSKWSNRLSFSTDWKNILIDKNGEFTLIDLD